MIKWIKRCYLPVFEHLSTNYANSTMKKQLFHLISLI